MPIPPSQGPMYLKPWSHVGMTLHIVPSNSTVTRWMLFSVNLSYSSTLSPAQGQMN